MDEDRRQNPAADRERNRTRLLMVLMRHVGKPGRIGMGELYEAVFGEPWEHRINDTRKLRGLITELRQEGVPICSTASQKGGGYWVPSAASELDQYCKTIRFRALKLLQREAKLRKLTMPELMGQLSLEDVI